MSDQPSDFLPAEVRERVDLCISHAEALLDGARRLLADPALPHLAFHLSILALEEVGKAGLYVIEALGMTTALLEMARLKENESLSPELAETYEWFFQVVDERENFNLMFGKKSMDKLRELRDGRAWMKWIRGLFEEADQEARALAEREVGRRDVADHEASDPKWRFTLRLRTQSHAIRAAELGEWNERVPWIQSVYVQKPDELIVRLELPKGVLAGSVYEIGLDTANQLLAAFNIGSRGFFWWYFPEHLFKYYEKLDDLETTRELAVERRFGIRMDWAGGVLDRAALTRVLLVFSLLPRGDDAEEGHECFVECLNGVAVLAKGDIHFHAEGSAYRHFFSALKQATGMGRLRSSMRLRAHWDTSSRTTRMRSTSFWASDSERVSARQT